LSGCGRRAADAAEKVTVERPELLHPHKQELLGLLVETEQIELRWHLALMVPRLELSASECNRAASALQRYLEDRSSIVKTCAVQGLADLAAQDPRLREMARRIIEESLRTGTAAMKARARKLLKKLKTQVQGGEYPFEVAAFSRTAASLSLSGRRHADLENRPKAVRSPGMRRAVDFLALTPIGKQQGLFSTERGAAWRPPQMK
jgi:hypothetical protein